MIIYLIINTETGRLVSTQIGKEKAQNFLDTWEISEEEKKAYIIKQINVEEIKQ